MVLRVYSRLLILFCLITLAHLSAVAQIKPGIKFGLSTPDVQPEDFIVTDDGGQQLYHVFVEKARYGVHAGLFIQMQLGHFYIQPEILYNSTSVDYRLDTLLTDQGTALFRDTYHYLDFPVTLGLKAGPVRLGGGPVAHIFLENGGAFGGYDQFEPFFEDLTWGWQAGIGFDFWKLHLDFRYEGNFSKLGDYITFFGRRFDFDTNNNRLIGSIGFSF
jgi:hypothetical protein